MNDFILYLLKVSAATLLFYLAYLLIKRNEYNFKLLRLYLLSSLVFSFGLSAVNFYYTVESSAPIANELVISEEAGVDVKQELVVAQKQERANTSNEIEWSLLLNLLYVLGVVYVIGGIIYSYYRVRKIQKLSQKQEDRSLTIYRSRKKFQAFSFLKSIYIPSNISEEEERHVLAHEKIHVSQFHSLDLLTIELALAVAWFNPVLWLMKRELQQIHEYLADREVLNQGVDSEQYQAVLLNRIAEERLINLSSAFSYLTIKKRFKMMKIDQRKRNRKKLFVLPLVAILLAIGFACSNPKESKKEIQKSSFEDSKELPKSFVELKKMNVLYVGVENPVELHIPGVSDEELYVEITNASIKKEGVGDYVIVPRRPGGSVLSLGTKLNGTTKILDKTHFRVKRVPDPVALLAGKKSGKLKKDMLLEQIGLKAMVENFDFELRFEISEFTLSTVLKGFTREERSDSNKLTQKQKDLLKQLKKGDKFFVYNIEARGPDGTTRDLSPMNFEIN
jgi:beta-lactamase regulating signal transducer with metallopeptidase domain